MTVQYFTLRVYVNIFNLSIIARLLDSFQIFAILNKFFHVHLFFHILNFSPLGFDSWKWSS